ncbi:MAG TPA: MBL fold metallo-hydrolase [Victivallales bacterium]|nr:MBL fold metallo-hydrolase [Victivallales bacterium]
MTAKITILCNDKVELFSSYIGEHGFSCFIETDQGNYLFDTGQGLGIIHNALLLNKNLRDINGIILSHAHYDHTSGLESILRVTGDNKIYAHPDIFDKKYDCKKGKTEYTGIRYSVDYLSNLGAEFILNREFSEIGTGIYLTGEVPRINDFEQSLTTQFVEHANIRTRDNFKDDNSLAIDTDQGLVIILGCAHAGIINILDYFTKKLNKKIYAVIGGTHLHPADEHRVKKTIECLKTYDIKKIGTSHCTGSKEIDIIKAFGNRFFEASVGTKLHIGSDKIGKSIDQGVINHD